MKRLLRALFAGGLGATIGGLGAAIVYLYGFDGSLSKTEKDSYFTAMGYVIGCATIGAGMGGVWSFTQITDEEMIRHLISQDEHRGKFTPEARVNYARKS